MVTKAFNLYPPFNFPLPLGIACTYCYIFVYYQGEPKNGRTKKRGKGERYCNRVVLLTDKNYYHVRVNILCGLTLVHPDTLNNLLGYY